MLEIWGDSGELDSAIKFYVTWKSCLESAGVLEFSEMVVLSKMGGSCFWDGGVLIPQQTMLTKGDLNDIWITWHTPWFLLTLTVFLSKSANFAISRNINIEYVLIHNF